MTIFLFLIISYVITPIFSQSSACLYLLANNPYDKTIQILPCVKLTTFPEHLYPVYRLKNNIMYQQNAVYDYDLNDKYLSPMVHLFFAYGISYGVVCIVNKLLRVINKC